MTTALRYTILSGDTLSAVAKGVASAQGVSYQQIAAANPDTPANALRVGQLIDIPDGNGTGVALSYTVLSGDSYALVATGVNAAAGVSVAEITAANPGLNPHALSIGAIIDIPPANALVEEPAELPVDATYMGYWAWTWGAGAQPPAGANLGVAFSGWADLDTALQESARIQGKLLGTKYFCIGGGGRNGQMTAAVLSALDSAMKQGRLAGYDGVAYDVEEGASGLEAAFTQSFALAKSLGLKVLVTVSHSCPYGISDGPTLMQSFFANRAIDVLSPQLYTTGKETQNDYTWARVPWSDYATAKAAIAPALVRASYYPGAKDHFASQGVTLQGYIQWSQ